MSCPQMERQNQFASIEEPADRLRELVRKTLNGGCKILSEGDDCKCGLCDVDRLVRLAYAGLNKKKRNRNG